jgi:hypothetical protein
MSDLLAAALDYAARGLTVFPTNCNTAGNIYTAVVRLALDATAMVAAIRSDAGASRRLLVAALEQRFTLLVSVALMPNMRP